MIESVEIGCSHGMNGNVLNGNVCPTAPINVSVPTAGGQILPELSLLTFNSREQRAVHFLKDFGIQTFEQEFAKNRFMATKEHINSYEFKKISGSVLE
jgi:hypothetical protein